MPTDISGETEGLNATVTNPLAVNIADVSQVIGTAFQVPVTLISARGEQIDSLNGGINVHLADTHDKLINHFFVQQPITGSATVVGTASQGATVFGVADAGDLAANSFIDIEDGGQHIHLYRSVTDVTGTAITIDSPLDVEIDDGSLIEETPNEMNVNGSLASPISFRVIPQAGEVFHILRILVQIEDNTAPDDSKFGGGTALTNGVVVREVKDTGTTITTLANWKSNGNMKKDMYDVDYTDKAGGGNHGVAGRWTFKRVEFVSILNGDNDDYLEVLIQDDLTGLVSFQVKAQGHFEE